MNGGSDVSSSEQPNAGLVISGTTQTDTMVPSVDPNEFSAAHTDITQSPLETNEELTEQSVKAEKLPATGVDIFWIILVAGIILTPFIAFRYKG